MLTDHRRRAAFLMVGGGAILASAVLHAMVNVPHLREDLLEIGTRPGLLAAVSLVLYFSVIAMVAFGSLVLATAFEMRRGRPAPAAPLWVTAGAYVAFGLVAFAVQQEAIEDALAAHGLGDLGFLVVLAEFGEVHHLVPAPIAGFAVDFEHHLLGVAGQGHGIDPIVGIV